jgi:hypothetical protein
MELSFAHSNVAAMEGLYQPPTTNRCMVGLQVVLLGAPTSLASIMVIAGPPHHALPSHTPEVAPAEVGQREAQMVRSAGVHRKVLV